MQIRVDLAKSEQQYPRTSFHQTSEKFHSINIHEQAGAELGQAQIKIGSLGNLANFTYYICLIELAI